MLYTKMIQKIRGSLARDLVEWNHYRFHPEYKQECAIAVRNIKALLKRLHTAEKFAKKHRM